MLWIDEELKLDLVVDAIVGSENDQFKYSSKEGVEEVTIDDEQSLTREWMIEMLADRLKQGYPESVQKKQWFPIRFGTESGRPASMRRTVYIMIDENPSRWMGRDGPFFYSESDRQRIVQRCAKGIAERLKKYEKTHKIQYKILDNGEVGFRYE